MNRTLESPFLEGQLFERESAPDRESRASALASESPFLNALPQGLEPLESLRTLERRSFDEEPSLEGEPPDSPLDALAPSELKAVRITSTFETGRAGSFGGLTGNFDGQGVSFGLMNFAWKAGSLITLLQEFLRDHPAAFADVFEADAGRFREIVLAMRPDPKNPSRQVRDIDRQMEFARDVLNDASSRIREPWRRYFGRLETNPDFRRIQVKAVRRAADRARYWCQYFGLTTERGFAFMFDLVSSHGGAWLNADKFKGKRRELLRAMLKKKKAEVGRTELTETEKLEVIANMIADVSAEKWRTKVRARKLWFVKGRGKVHGDAWDLARDFGVTDAPPDFGQETLVAELRQAPEEGVEFGESFISESEPPESEDFASEGSADYFGGVTQEALLGEEPEEPEEAFTGEEKETTYAEEDREVEDQAEMQVCSPYLSEAQQEELAELESASDSPFVVEEEGEPAIESEYDVRLLSLKAATDRAPAEVALVVHQWGTTSARVSGARLKVYECDIGEAGRSDTSTASNVQMGEFTLDLVPNPEFAKSPGKAGIPEVTVARAKWANDILEKSYKATRNPDVILKLGSSAFPLWIPREDILEEGIAVEIGFVLEDSVGNRVERISPAPGQRVSVSIPDYLQVLLNIPGRFDDPKRDAAVEKDGTRFDVFLNGKNRREFIRKWLDERPALKAAANEPNADLKIADILKAWFIIHDVGVGASLTDKRFKANQPPTKRGAVHGFLNRAGYYAATHDFTKNKQGTVYEFLSKKGIKHVNGRTINIETVPDIEKGVPDKPGGAHGDPSKADLYASIGYKRVYNKGVYVKRVDYYKWTKTAFDVLADLYIFASARARHLLTITAHKEVDRNLGRSVIWREYSAAQVRAAKKGSFLGKARDTPSNYHGDPYGFNIQALYDLITRKLNALGGRQMPAGARYGIHPRRVCKADGEDIVNGSHHLHEFPHQSDPEVRADGDLKKSGWWNA